MAALIDGGATDFGMEASIAKLRASDLAMKMATECVQFHGGYGYIREYPLERFVRDVRVHQILEGTNEIMRHIIARRLLLDGATEILS